MQRAEMEELRQREANLTALQAIGPRKKPRLDGSNSSDVSKNVVYVLPVVLGWFASYLCLFPFECD